jgi:integrase
VNLKKQFETFLLEEDRKKPSTVEAYLYRLAWLERYFGKPVEEVTADDLRQLKRERPVSSQTLKGEIVAIQRFHVWGSLEKLWAKNGICDVKPPPVDDEDSPPPLPIHQARTLMAACRRPLEYRVIYYPLLAGTRIGESAEIDGSNWHDDGVLRFRGKKNGRVREIPIHPELERVKWVILASMPTDTSSLQRVARRLKARTGIKFRTHQLRKTFSTVLYDDDVPDEVVKDLLGHVGDVTRRYAPVSMRRKRNAMPSLDVLVPPRTETRQAC